MWTRESRDLLSSSVLPNPATKICPKSLVVDGSKALYGPGWYTNDWPRSVNVVMNFAKCCRSFWVSVSWRENMSAGWIEIRGTYIELCWKVHCRTTWWTTMVRIHVFFFSQYLESSWTLDDALFVEAEPYFQLPEKCRPCHWGSTRREPSWASKWFQIELGDP